MYRWIDEEIEANSNQVIDTGYYLRQNPFHRKRDPKIFVSWYMKFLKKEGLSNEEIYRILERMFQLEDLAYFSKNRNSNNVARWFGCEIENLSWDDCLRYIKKDWVRKLFVNLEVNLSHHFLKHFVKTSHTHLSEYLLQHLEPKMIFSKRWDNSEANYFAFNWDLSDFILAEEDSAEEKMHIRFSYSWNKFMQQKIDYLFFEKWMNLLRKVVVKRVEESLALIAKATITAIPFKCLIKNKTIEVLSDDIEDSSSAMSLVSRGTNDLKNNIVPKLEEIRKYREYVQELANLYSSKSKSRWNNVCYYDTCEFNQEDAQEMRSSECKSQLDTTNYIISLFNVIYRTSFVMTTEESSEFAMGKNIAKQGVNCSENLRENDFSEFRINVKKEDLILFLNADDFYQLELGKSCPITYKLANLYSLKKHIGKIYPLKEMERGYARLLDRKALKMYPHLENVFLWKEDKDSKFNFDIIYTLNVCMFQNFAGCVFAPKIPQDRLP